jgi:antitoxin component of MazEF toxin-antitoxin module
LFLCASIVHQTLLLDAKLVIEITKPKRRYTLDELAAGIAPENRHEEVGPPVGNGLVTTPQTPAI